MAEKIIEMVALLEVKENQEEALDCFYKHVDSLREHDWREFSVKWGDGNDCALPLIPFVAFMKSALDEERLQVKALREKLTKAEGVIYE